MKTNINIFNALNESLEEEFKAKKIKRLKESEDINPNNLTKEQLWKLRQEIVLGSLYINDYENSFGINPNDVYSFFDSFIENAQQDDEGNYNNRKTEDFDNAEELYNYYLSCENPFGDLNEADKVEIDKDGNKSIRDTKTGHLKKITVSKKTQDKMADEYNKKLDESSGDRYEVWQRYYDDEFNRNGEYVQSFSNYEEASNFADGLMKDSDCEAWIVDKFEESSLNETGEWDDNDEEMSAWLEDMRSQAKELADEISGEVKSVTGFDAYQGPRAVVHSPKHGDVIMWFDPEDDTGRSFNVKVAHVGWIQGGINRLADLLNQDEIPENEIINEASFNDKVKAIKKSLRKDKRTTAKSSQKSAEKIAGSMIKNESEEDFYNYVKGLLDNGAIDDPEYYNSLSDKEKEDLIRNTWMKDKEIIENYKKLNESEEPKAKPNFYWLDNDTFVMEFDVEKDNEGDPFNYMVEYWLDDGSFHFLKVYEYDTVEADFSEEKKSELINLIKEKIKESKVNEEDIIKVNDVEIEPDYIIQDVTVLDQVGDGDVQSPDIEAMLTLVDSALKESYSKEWGHIKTLSSKIDENTSYALVDISTPEILKEFENKGIRDAAIGKNLILEKVNDKLVEFKVNNLNGTTKYSKKTSNPQKAIYEWIETEFLQEAKEEKAKELEIIKAKTEKETVENYINNRLDLRMEIENIKMFIELSKEVKAQEEMKPTIQKRMYAFAAEVPYNIEVKFKNDQYELSFSNLDQVVEMVFGKEWVKEVTPDNEVIGVIKESSLPNISKFIYDLDKDEGNAWSAEHYTEDGRGNKIIIVSRNGDSNNSAKDIKKAVEEKYPNLKGEITENNKGIWFYLTESQKINESYEQFNIGEIEVVFNPDTYETLYSIPSADVQDKKINLTKVPTVDTPYDTDTIIKSYIETRFGRIPTEEEKKAEDNNEVTEPTSETPEAPEKEEIPQEDINIDKHVEIDSDLSEDELPDEPEENEVSVEPEEELPKAETGNAIFMKVRPKQSISVEDLRNQQLDGNTPTSNYIVVDNLDLSTEEFNDLSNNLNQPRSYLEGIQALDRKNYSFNVVKITNNKANYDLLIDPLGYNYPRYVAILDKN